MSTEFCVLPETNIDPSPPKPVCEPITEQPSRIAPHIDISTTQPAMRTIAMPADTNPNGDIFGGWILAQMDLAGGSHAFREAQGRVATVAITGMHFHKPVNVGDEVSCYCVTECIGNTSVAVHVEAWVRRGRRNVADEMVTEGLFTFVALDENGKPRAVTNTLAATAASPRAS